MAALLVVLFLSGCTTYTTMHTAHPIPEGTTEFSAGSGLVGSFDPNKREGTGVVPTVAEAQLRVGVDPRFDVGIRGYVTGFLIDANFMFLDLGVLAASINPAFGGLFSSDPEDPDSGEGWGYSTGWLTLLVDLMPERATTLTIAPRAGFIAVSDSRGADDDNVATTQARVGLVGAMVGIRQRITDGVALAPEAGVYMVNLNREEPLYAASIALSFRD